MAASRFGTGMHGSGPPMARSVAPGGGEPGQRVGGVGGVELAALADRVGGLGGVEVAAGAAASTIASEAWVAAAGGALCAGRQAGGSGGRRCERPASGRSVARRGCGSKRKVEDGPRAFFRMAGGEWRVGGGATAAVVEARGRRTRAVAAVAVVVVATVAVPTAGGGTTVSDS